jgi:hypothetical protein
MSEGTVRQWYRMFKDGMIDVHDEEQRSSNKRCLLPESWWQLFFGTGKSADGGIHATMDHNNTRSVL